MRSCVFLLFATATCFAADTDLQGIWEVRTSPANLEAHSADAGIRAGESVIVDPADGKIPYKPEAAAQQKENFKNRMKLDPEVKCYMPGIPRANYMPFPFQIIQSQRDIAFAYEFATANRVVNMGKAKEAAVDTWMGTSNGHWEGDVLVVDVSGLNGNSWFDRSGNFQTDSTHVVERFSLSDADHINYEATIEDPPRAETGETG